jgi:hypothetical protein
MSGTQFVEYGEHGFWATHGALGVFLKYLIDSAETAEQANSHWLSHSIPEWRAAACISDFGLKLDTAWSEAE